MNIFKTVLVALALGAALYLVSQRPASSPSSPAVSVPGAATLAERPSSSVEHIGNAASGERLSPPRQTAGAAEALSLTEILLGADGTPIAATIAQAGERGSIYRIGDLIIGAGGARVHTILADRVTLDRDGRLETLPLASDVVELHGDLAYFRDPPTEGAVSGTEPVVRIDVPRRSPSLQPSDSGFVGFSGAEAYHRVPRQSLPTSSETSDLVHFDEVDR